VVAGVVLPQQPGARRFAVALVGIVIGVAMALLVAVPKPA
jgi:hypothetical protein